MQELSIVFLHGFWRSSSTYFWNKFKYLNKTIAFYEPFHEILDSNLEDFPSNSSKDWESNHPNVSNYWEEYKRLGIKPSELFTQTNGSFVTVDYYLFTKEKKSYLKNLIDLSIQNNYKRIVFGCVRSVAMAKDIRGFITKHYPKTNQLHIFFERSPLNQFESFVGNDFYHNNKYFLAVNTLPVIFKFPKLAKSIDFDLNLDFKDTVSQNLNKVYKFSELMISPYLSFCKAFLINKYISLAIADESFDKVITLEDLMIPKNLIDFQKYLSEKLKEEIDLKDFKISKPYSFFNREYLKIIAEDVRALLSEQGLINEIQSKSFSLNEDASLEINNSERTIHSSINLYLTTLKERFKKILEEEKLEVLRKNKKISLNKKIIKKLIDIFRKMFIKNKN